MPKAPEQDLLTLAVEDGVEHILDLSTGQQMRTLPAPLREMRRIAERSVNKDRVQAVLRAAGIATSRDAEDDLLATVFGLEVSILISPDYKFVRFLKFRELRAFVPDETLSEALRQVGLAFDVVRFRSRNDGLVCADYSMTYEHGISPQQMVGMLRGFAWTVKEAFESEEFEDLLAR